MRGASLLRLARAARSCNTFKVSPELAACYRQGSSQTCVIPAGHRNSDLREEVCNKGLNRRLDLIMRGDIKLDTTSGPKTLKDLLKVGLLNFYSTIRKWVPTMTAQHSRRTLHRACCAQGHISVICGLPDMGKVCEEHVKGFLDQAEALKDEGVKKVMILAVDKASVVDRWLREKHGEASSSVMALGDDNGAFTRMLGVNINDPDRAQKTQRCAYFQPSLSLPAGHRYTPVAVFKAVGPDFT